MEETSRVVSEYELLADHEMVDLKAATVACSTVPRFQAVTGSQKQALRQNCSYACRASSFDELGAEQKSRIIYAIDRAAKQAQKGDPSLLMAALVSTDPKHDDETNPHPVLSASGSRRDGLRRASGSALARRVPQVKKVDSARSKGKGKGRGGASETLDPNHTVPRRCFGPECV